VDATLLCHDNPMLLLCQTTGTSSSSKKSRWTVTSTKKRIHLLYGSSKPRDFGGRELWE
jgi:hypothetical protein